MRIQLSHCFEEVISIENLLEAWAEFIRDKRGKQDAQEFQIHLLENIVALHDELVGQRYIHGGYTAFRISDPKPRDIHKANVRDRILHHALHRKLYPFFDRIFIADSFSSRVDKGVHKALDRFTAFSGSVSQNNTRTCWVLKCDIKKFFANIDHAILLNALAASIVDKKIIWLLQTIIHSFETRPAVGLPLGNLTSQLFVNVYMNLFDQFMKHVLKARFYIRYADDFVILSQDRSWLKHVLLHSKNFLSLQLNLELHPHKVSVKTLASGVDFLGWVHFPHHRVLRTTTKRRMLRNLAKHTSEETLQSYLGLLRHGNTVALQHLITEQFFASQNTDLL